MELLNPSHRSGQCSAWAGFLIDCGKLAGAPDYYQTAIAATPSDNADYIEIKNQGWGPGGAISYGHDPYYYKNKVNMTWHYNGYSIACQGNEQPVIQQFENHVIVFGLNGGLYFDPCYGKFSISGVLDLENQEVDALCKKFNDTGFLNRKKSDSLTTPFLQFN